MFNSISNAVRTSTFESSLSNTRQVLAAACLNAEADRRRDLQYKLMLAKGHIGW